MSSSLRAHACPAAGRLLQAHVLVRPDTDRATAALAGDVAGALLLSGSNACGCGDMCR